MKELLLLMPNFFDYPKVIIEEFRNQNFAVDYICNECKEYGYFWNKSFFRKILRGLIPLVRKYDIKKAENIVYALYEKQLEDLKGDYNYILCIKGDFFPDGLYRLLKKKYTNAKFILYQWDDVHLLQKCNHFKYFDYLYSYNVSDCKKYGASYLPMFSVMDDKITSVSKKYDIAIIGTIDKSHRQRLRLIEKIYEVNRNKYSFYIYLYKNDKYIETELPSYEKKLPFSNYMSILCESRCVLDIALPGQKAPTTRFNDALAVKAKVITTNKNIKKYPFYTRNVLIVNKRFSNISDSFIKTPFIDTDLVYMNIQRWISTLLGEK